VNVDEWGNPLGVAVVTALSPDGELAYVRYGNGFQSVVVNHDVGAEVGDVLAVFEHHVEFAPDGVWPSETWVGVVRMKTDEDTVVDSPNGLRLVPTSDGVDYAPGNTVLVEASGVARLLTTEPLRLIDLSAPDDASARAFEVTDKGGGPKFEDFGGLPGVVEQARRHVRLPIRERERLKAIGAKGLRGVLFTGAPGTGKTLLAQIIATEADAAFFKVSGPEIFSKYYGQSAEILRLVFTTAEAKAPAIIFFDEIDSVASSRSDSSHEESQRVVAQLLTLMDGIGSAADVVVIAATNRPDALDPALRRPGRFDLAIDFPLPTEADREEILLTASRKLQISGPMPFTWLAHNTARWSGAELAAIWTEAALYAVEDGRSVLTSEDAIGGYERVLAQRLRAPAASWSAS
jgi:transitional endoplasmic reticulum ATPase